MRSALVAGKIQTEVNQLQLNNAKQKPCLILFDFDNFRRENSLLATRYGLLKIILKTFSYKFKIGIENIALVYPLSQKVKL